MQTLIIVILDSQSTINLLQKRPRAKFTLRSVCKKVDFVSMSEKLHHNRLALVSKREIHLMQCLEQTVQDRWIALTSYVANEQNYFMSFDLHGSVTPHLAD